MLAHPQLSTMLAHPSVSYGSDNLYMRGVLEEETRPNLSRPAAELLGLTLPMTAPVSLTVNDKRLAGPIRVRLKLGGDGGPMDS